MVEQQDLHFTAVVLVDYTRAHVNEVLGCEAGAGGNAAICPGGNGDGDASGDEGFATFRDDGFARAVVNVMCVSIFFVFVFVFFMVGGGGVVPGRFFSISSF